MYFSNSIHDWGSGYPAVYVICPDRSFNRVNIDEFITDSLTYRIQECLDGKLKVNTNSIDYSVIPFTCFNLMGQIIDYDQIQINTIFIKKYDNGLAVKEIKK